MEGLSTCASACNQDSGCVGFTTDPTRVNCYLYETVPALTTADAAGDAYFSKPGLPIPSHPPIPPPPPPPPAPPSRPPTPGIVIDAVVPGDILTDLERAHLTPSPYFNVTWRDPAYVALWNTGTWVYSTTFPTPAQGNGDALLVFDGIRMGAMIHLVCDCAVNCTRSHAPSNRPFPFGYLCDVLAGFISNLLHIATW